VNARTLAVATRSAAIRSVRDPAALLVRLGFYAVVASVVATLWRAAAASHGGSIAGYTGHQLTWYIITSEAAIIAVEVRLIEDIGNDIVSGSVVVEMLRPVSVVWLRIATEFGRSLPRLLACVAVGTVLATIFAGPPASIGALVVAAPALVLAVACNIVAQHAFAAAAFWVRDARSTWFLYQKLVFILGGMLLPLQFLPGALHAFALALPFVAMAYVPARLASGHFEPQLLAVQCVWLFVLAVSTTIVFTAGEKRLQVAGG
jgi:ABC-2 type transport system permease protein